MYGSLIKLNPSGRLNTLLKNHGSVTTCFICFYINYQFNTNSAKPGLIRVCTVCNCPLFSTLNINELRNDKTDGSLRNVPANIHSVHWRLAEVPKQLV